MHQYRCCIQTGLQTRAGNIWLMVSQAVADHNKLAASSRGISILGEISPNYRNLHSQGIHTCIWHGWMPSNFELWKTDLLAVLVLALVNGALTSYESTDEILNNRKPHWQHTSLSQIPYWSCHAIWMHVNKVLNICIGTACNEDCGWPAFEAASTFCPSKIYHLWNLYFWPNFNVHCSHVIFSMDTDFSLLSFMNDASSLECGNGSYPLTKIKRGMKWWMIMLSHTCAVQHAVLNCKLMRVRLFLYIIFKFILINNIN
jgi:hypothetical protein